MHEIAMSMAAMYMAVIQLFLSRRSQVSDRDLEI
jgi:hypothetical protein